MSKTIAALLVLVSMLSACNPISAPTISTLAITSQLVPTRQPAATGSPTATAAPTSTVTATFTPSPTATPVPTATPTPLGGGSGVVLLRNCPTWDECSWSEFSLHSMQLYPSTRPYFKSVKIDQNPYKWRLDLYNPTSGETKTILECPADYANCAQDIISGSLEDDWLFLAQKYNKQKYDGKSVTELYRLQTASLEATLVDQFEGDIYGFIPLEGSSQVLMSSLSDVFRGELLIYDLETLERRTIISRMGQFYRIGTTPDENVFYYRITDYCETELVTREGNRIPAIQNSDGILGWIDDETFLVFTASDNPPVCTRTGIAQANRYGLTGEWVTNQRVESALLSPDGKKVFYTSDCNSQGCTKLLVANLDGSNAGLVLENPDRSINGEFSPDGSQLLITAGKEIWVVNSDGTQPNLIMETDEAWRVMDWLD